MTRRRTFLALLGAAAVVSTTSTGTANETDEEGETDPAGPTEDLEPAEALVAYVVANYGDRLDGEDREAIREGIEGSLAAADAFGDVGLENADEPAYGFSAYRGDRS